MMLQFEVNKQTLIRRDGNNVVANSKNYLYARFVFDADWDGVSKTAVFKQGDDSYSVILDNDRCLVPYEVIKSGSFWVSVFGGDLITSNMVEVKVKRSGLFCGRVPGEPAPSLYAQLLAEINKRLPATDLGEVDNYVACLPRIQRSEIYWCKASGVPVLLVSDITEAVLTVYTPEGYYVHAGSMTDGGITWEETGISPLMPGDVQEATLDTAGVVKPDGSTIVLGQGGAISAAKATLDTAGVVKPDGTTTTVDADGTLHAAGGIAADDIGEYLTLEDGVLDWAYGSKTYTPFCDEQTVTLSTTVRAPLVTGRLNGDIPDLVLGNQYQVVYGGTAYLLTPQVFEDMTCIGTLSYEERTAYIAEETDSIAAGFIIVPGSGDRSGVTDTMGNGSVTLQIYDVSYDKVPGYLLPRPDWNQNEVGGEGYIANRPFYEEWASYGGTIAEIMGYESITDNYDMENYKITDRAYTIEELENSQVYVDGVLATAVATVEGGTTPMLTVETETYTIYILSGNSTALSAVGLANASEGTWVSFTGLTEGSIVLDAPGEITKIPEKYMPYRYATIIYDSSIIPNYTCDMTYSQITDAVWNNELAGIRLIDLQDNRVWYAFRQFGDGNITAHFNIGGDPAETRYCIIDNNGGVESGILSPYTAPKIFATITLSGDNYTCDMTGQEIMDGIAQGTLYGIQKYASGTVKMSIAITCTETMVGVSFFPANGVADDYTIDLDGNVTVGTLGA